MEVTVIKSNRKTIAIQVDFNQNVTVRAPYSVSEKYIEEFLKKESTEDYSEYRFIFTDSITKFIKQWESGIENQKNIDIQINIVDFCNHLYWAAEPFYKKHSKETILKNIIFSFSEGEY